MRPAAYVFVIVFAILALMQLLRLIMQSEVILDGIAVPMWASVPGFLLYAGLPFCFFAKRGDKANEKLAAYFGPHLVKQKKR
jgi:hypothetical protein